MQAETKTGAFLVLVFVAAFFLLLWPRMQPGDAITAPYVAPVIREQPAVPCSDRAPAEAPTGDGIMAQPHPWVSHADVAEQMWAALKAGTCVPIVHTCPGSRRMILECPGLLYGKTGLFVLAWDILSMVTGQYSLRTMYLKGFSSGEARTEWLKENLPGCNVTAEQFAGTILAEKGVEVYVDE